MDRLPLRVPVVNDNGTITDPWRAYLQANKAPSGNSQMTLLSYVPSTGVTDAVNRARDIAPAFQAAFNAAATAGGADILVPAGNYSMRTAAGISLTAGMSNIRLVFDQNAVIYRDVTLNAGQGVFNVNGARDITLAGVQIDGQVTSPAGVQYSTIAGDPMAAVLLANTSLWIKGGSKRVRVVPRITHTGGYAVLVDARTADIEDVTIEDGFFLNNYPHLFGTNPADLNYGSWTGNIHYQADGTTNQIRGLHVLNNSIRRSSGTGVWGHTYANTKQNKGVTIQGNYLEDLGFHGVQLGEVDGAIVSGNYLHRIGYPTINDSGAPVPRYLASYYASAIDMAGSVRNASITGNNVLSANGDCFDLDGLESSYVHGNQASIPLSGEAAYTDDQIAIIGPGGGGANYTYGMQTGLTYSASAAQSVMITGNRFKNLGGGAIRLYGARNCVCSQNVIEHPPSPAFAPICVGYASGTHATGNVITDNTIYYSPAGGGATYGGIAAIYEDPQLGAFGAGDVNVVFGNRIRSSVDVIEFLRDLNSGSTAPLVFPTNTPTPATSSHIVERTGKASDSSSALQWSLMEGLNRYEHMQLQGYWAATHRGPLLNVSEATVGGAISTGARTAPAFTDSMLTGKLYGDGFLVLSDSSFLDADANLLGNSYGLIRFRPGTGYLEQSVTTATGARVWKPLVAPPAGADTQVQYAKLVAGAVTAAADANFAWDYTAKKLTLTGVASTAVLNILNGYAQAAQGFYSPGVAATTLNIPNGGATALAFISVRNDGGAGLYLSRTAATAQDWSLNINSSGALDILEANPAGGGATRLSISPGGGIYIGGPSHLAFDQSGNITFSGTLANNTASGGINLSAATAYNSIQTTGGIQSGLNIVTTGGGFYCNATQAVNSSAVFVGAGVNCPSNGITGSGFNPYHGGVQYNGVADYTLDFTFSISGTTYNHARFVGGVLIGVS